VFVPLRADEPLTAIDWSDPEKQWREFLGGFQNRNGSRNGRPTGVAVGPEGSLFVADDAAGVIYRIRPTH
jgi:glucose/arabinose dehydrogenase